MPPLNRSTWISIVLLAGLPGIALADVVDVPASKDNTMFAEDGGLSNGAGYHLFAGKTNGTLGTTLRRGLLAFDVAAAVPAGATINSVTLTLFLSRERTGSETVFLHRVSADWGEGTSDAPDEEGKGAAATTEDATPSCRTRTTPTAGPPSKCAWTSWTGSTRPPAISAGS
jgi:hypothetical protein